MVNEALFCKRLLYLEWVQGEFAHNYFTADGAAVHARVDEEVALGGVDKPYKATSVWISSDALGVTAKIDTVEVDGGRVRVVEYKRGKTPDIPEGAYLPERAQVCLQVLLLRERGYDVEGADIYFAGSKRRVEIAITDELITETMTAIVTARQVCSDKKSPAPLVDSPKCVGCSLSSICLPDEVNASGEAGAGATIDGEIRRVHPLRDDRLPLHIQAQGARVGLSDDRIVVRDKKGEIASARIVHTSGVSIYGNAQISTQALRALMSEGIPVSFFTTGGWFCGRAAGHDSKNVDVRIAQFKTFADEGAALALARTVVATKIKNSRTMLRRNGEGDLDLMARLAADALGALSVESLLGIEGAAARAYFAGFSSMLKTELGFVIDGRSRRPPTDPVNALLSFGYALLVKDVTAACAQVGLDPMLGFYHRPRFGRPALALDLMEEWRSIVVDSAVISAVNGGEIEKSGFVISAGAVQMSPEVKKAFTHAYERRLDLVSTHPVFGYKISCRRALEVQARLLSRVLLGELNAYPAFEAR